jgi:hypothetical protein
VLRASAILDPAFHLQRDALRPAVSFAVQAAAITCSRRGADLSSMLCVGAASLVAAYRGAGTSRPSMKYTPRKHAMASKTWHSSLSLLRA